MKPQIVHRFTIPLQTVIEQLIGKEATDGEGFLVTVEDDELIVDIIEPAGLRSAKPEVTLEPGFQGNSQGPTADAPSNEAEKINTPEKPKGGPLAQRAAIMCGERGFWTFISKKYDRGIGTADDAAAWLKAYCGVESRVEFDHDEARAADFRDVEKNYRLWLDGFD